MFNTFIEICKLLGIFLQDYFYRLIRKLKREKRIMESYAQGLFTSKNY